VYIADAAAAVAAAATAAAATARGRRPRGGYHAGGKGPQEARSGGSAPSGPAAAKRSVKERTMPAGEASGNSSETSPPAPSPAGGIGAIQGWGALEPLMAGRGGAERGARETACTKILRGCFCDRTACGARAPTRHA
jgi:hypothetical protein